MDKTKVIISGAIIGLLGVLLVLLGNPANMGICLACFIRDIAGGLGLHRAGVVQYLRPEIPGFILGSFISALIAKEFRSRGGSSPIIRFFIAVFIMFGALIFLGCPLRMIFRMASGDLNAWVAFPGFILGIYIGLYFLKRGYSLGRNNNQSRANGLFLPLIAVFILILLVLKPSFVFFSQEGPGSLAAPVALALVAGLVVGFISQKTRICTAGGIRDVLLLKDFHLASGLFAIFVVALILNLYFGSFKISFVDQPIAHTDGVWNFLGMALVGFGAILLGGCPFRQTILAGEGDSDAGITVIGLIVGGALAHNFGIASSTAGATFNGKISLLVGFIFLFAVAVLNSSEIVAKFQNQRGSIDA